jgi:sporulation protein YlmC with PRC-barrel domain
MPSARLSCSLPSMRLETGAQVTCADGVFGELADVVIDPVARRVTHLVVEPHHDHGLARLVPVALLDDDGEPRREIRLRCTLAELEELRCLHEFNYVRVGEAALDDPEWDVGIETVLATRSDAHVAIAYDRIPKDEVEIRRTSAVVSADEHQIGRVDGFVVDGDGQITHLVLERGHLWGRREVTIPIGSVATVETDVVTLSMSKDEVGSLPSARA